MEDFISSENRKSCGLGKPLNWEIKIIGDSENESNQSCGEK